MTTKLNAAVAVSKAKVQELYNFPTIVKKVGSVLEGDTWLALDTNRIWTYEKEKFVDYGIYTGKLKVTQTLKGDIPSTKFLPGRSTRLITTSYTTKLNYKDGVYFNLTDSKLRVTLEEQVLTPLASIVTIYPTIDEDGKTHRYSWIQLTGPEVAWLSPQSELKLSIQKPELGPEYSFRLILDRGTDHEQYHDVVLQDDVYDTVYLPNITVKEISAVDSPGAGLTNFALVPAISPPGTATLNNPDFAVTWNNPSEAYPAVYSETDAYTYSYGNLNYLYTFNTSDTLFTSKTTDLYSDKVVVLLKFEGPNESTDIVDSSFNPKPISNYNGVVISTADKKFGSSSLYIRVNSSNREYQHIQINEVTDLLFAGDYTVELFVKKPYNDVIFSNAAGTFLYNSSLWINDQIVFFSTLSAIRNETNWQHIAIVRHSGVLTVYKNGIALDSAQTNNVHNWSNLVFGRYEPNGYSGVPFQGYIDNVRITKDVARYIENFTPPQKEFILHKPNTQDIYVFRTFYDIYGVGQHIRSVDKKVNFLANSGSSTVDGTDLINLNIASTANAVPNLVASRNISISTQTYQDINVFLRNPKTSTAGYNLISERILELVVYDSQPVEDTINIVNPKSSVTSAKIYQARSLTNPGNIVTYFQI